MKNIITIVCICWCILTSCVPSATKEADEGNKEDSITYNDAGVVQTDLREMIRSTIISIVDGGVGDPDDGVFYRVVDGEKEANDVFEVLCGGLEIEDSYQGVKRIRKATLPGLGSLVLHVRQDKGNADEIAEMYVNIDSMYCMKKVIFRRTEPEIGEESYQRGNLNDLDD